MTDEEKKALEVVKNIEQKDLLDCWDQGEEEYKALQILLDLIQKLEKVIDEMAEYMENVDYTEQLCEYCINDKKECTKKECIEQIKEHFYIKVEEEL